jgi:N-acetylmuramic acid 6-phosphate etherase
MNINMANITESSSNYDNLEQMSIRELLEGIHNEDKKVLPAVERAIPQIEKLVSEIVPRVKKGGRLFYVGAGTSGRLGILDASEIPPTYGVGYDLVIGIIAGGDQAIRKAVESAEDDENLSWKILKEYNINEMDTVVGIAASGRTPYVVGAVKNAREHGILTACIAANPDTVLSRNVDIAIEAIVGPEFVTGSTRMKSGTAQKLILNMITTTLMIQLGRVKGNKMVNMQLTNRKLVERGTKMIMEELDYPEEKAKRLLILYGSVQKVIDAFKEGKHESIRE